MMIKLFVSEIFLFSVMFDVLRASQWKATGNQSRYRHFAGLVSAGLSSELLTAEERCYFKFGMIWLSIIVRV